MDVSEDSSSTAGTYDYDVFLSFSGLNRRTVADELYDSLENAGIRVFKGEELGGGEDISSSLRRAIKRSRISIPIISDDYARKAQCLDQVVQMLECRESQGQKIFPIYHFVDPHDIRNQMSTFRNSFVEHEIGRIDPDRINIWKKALRQVAYLKGWEVLYGLLDEDRERIMSHVLQSLKEVNSSVNTDVSGVSSSVEGIRNYDVFLSFDPDIERDFADLLYRRLMDAGVLVVRGKDVPVGEQVVDFVPRAMKCSKISIPVLSKSYAWSRWCLDEVAGMVECRKSQGHRLFPIYYQINSFQIRNKVRDSGYIREKVDPDRLAIWERALREVTSLKGWKFYQRSGYDERVEHIVSHVLQSLREDTSSITMDVPVGSSLLKGTYDYNIFLNFGSDIEREFADPFYHRLKDARILVYRCEDVPVGEEIAGFALQAMKRSKISIPIFSKQYVRTEQCLDEVVRMLECRKSQGHRVFPIYYQINPEDIRNLTVGCEDIFPIHLRGVDRDRVQIWEQALREVASLRGWELDKQFQDGDIDSIISHVLQSLKEEDRSSITMDDSEGPSNLVDTIPNYNVYLNFGAGTRRGFADLLYHRLKDAGVLVFRDEDIMVGEDMVDFAQQVIKRSIISIPVFSKDYAKSQQRLDEVVQMLECKNGQGQCVFPIYYEIDPSRLRYDVDYMSFEHRSFGRHGRGKEDPHKIEMWNKALAEVASLERWELDDESMDDTVESVISKVLRVLNGEELLALDGGNADMNPGTSATPFDVVLSFNVCDGIACSFNEHMKDGGIRVFELDQLPFEEEEIDKEFVRAINNSKICIPFFTEDYLASAQCLRQLTHIMEARRSIPEQLVIPVFYDIEPPNVKLETDSYINALKEHEQNFPTEVVRHWTEALREVAELQGWKLKAEGSMDETIESAISKVRQALNGDELLELNGGNADSNPGTSATPFEVVLSFNVHDGIGGSFYEHMKDAGIRVFGSDELPAEVEEIDKEFVRAINNSEICIPFFTKDYLASAQCLRQLTHIMEARINIPGQLVLPIFYDVGPPDVKLETDWYINALKEHEQNFPMEVVRQWKEALTEVAELQGWRLKAAGFERYKKLVVIAILNKLKEKHRSMLIGMQDQVEKLKKVLDMESQDIIFVGIYGIGGIGKTTLARVVFDQLSTHFESCSFLRDVRETSKSKGVKYLQDQLLRDITCVDNDCETKTRRHIFHGKKVLIVLDDVDERGQIKKLIGKSNHFVSGSRIIVTTRDINVLAIESETLDGRILEWPKAVLPFKMVEMDSTEALQLFCCHTFGKFSPPDDYLRMCEEVVSRMGKLPLALEIMGSFLNHKPRSIWKATLEKLKNLPDHELHTKLMISYEALDLETKEVFLDIACFFTGQEKTTPFYMWDACELLPELATEALSFLSFVKVLSDNRLWMHDEVRDFGRILICGGSTIDSAKCSRLWANDKVLDVLRSREVNENVQGLRLCFDEFLLDCTFPREELGSLSNLRFLELLGFPFAVKRVLPKLRWLSWHFYPQYLKASDLHLENLVILDLSNSYISDQLGEPGQLEMAKHLKVLDLTNCKRITRTPIFSNSMILERLILEGCENLVKIDSSIGNLKCLMYLNLKGCYSLEELPNELGSATALTELIVKGNGQPFKLQESLVDLTSLSVLEIYSVKIVDPVVHIGNSKRLEFLILSDCFGIKKLMESDQFFSLLVKLDVSRSEISQLPDSIGEMKNLKVINMESSLISELPKSIGHLEKLEELHAKNCSGLHGEIPSEVGTLFSLEILDLSYTRISSLPSTLSQLSNLQTLNLECCEELEELPELPKSLISLRVMCKKLQSLPDLSKMNSLRDLQLFCALNQFQSDWFEKLSRLEKLELCIPRINILKFDDTSQLKSLSVSCKGIKTIAQLPSTLSRLCLANFEKGTTLPSLWNLKSLTSIEFYNCSFGDYEFMCLEVVKLNSLEHFSASNCYINSDDGLPLPEGLKRFSLTECELPEVLDLQTLKNLMCLELVDCQLLTVITGLEKSKSLEEITICNCSSLEILGDLSDVEKLEALQIDNCKKLKEVKGLDRMTSLKHLQICHCELLESLPSRLKLKKRRRELLTDLH